MKKLTRLRRHTFYVLMLEESYNLNHKIINGRKTFSGFCYAAKRLSGGSILLYNANRFQTLLPELFAKKPEGKGEIDYWFPADEAGWQKRRELLQQCINETL